MALFMLMGKYSPEALKAIVESESDREAAAKKLVESVGGKLHGFYGMFGQEHNVAVIIEVPGNAEYIGAIAPTVLSGTFTAIKTIALYTSGEMQKAAKIAKKTMKTYQPPKS